MEYICPHCNKPLDSATGALTGKGTDDYQPGDICVCLRCCLPSIVEAGLPRVTLRKLCKGDFRTMKPAGRSVLEAMLELSRDWKAAKAAFN